MIRTTRVHLCDRCHTEFKSRRDVAVILNIARGYGHCENAGGRLELCQGCAVAFDKLMAADD